MAEGYEWAAANPEEAAEIMQVVANGHTLSYPEIIRESQRAIVPSYLAPDGKWGSMTAKVWEDFVGFLKEEGLLSGRDGVPLPAESVPKIEELFTNDYLPKQ